MNRQIKFRGFTTHFSKGWVYGSLSVKNTIDEMTNFGWVSETIVEESSIGQFTAFRDKNGAEIYEGDILLEERKDKNDLVVYRKTHYVVFNKFDCAFELSDDREVIANPKVITERVIQNCAVIGNVYEHLC